MTNTPMGNHQAFSATYTGDFSNPQVHFTNNGTAAGGGDRNLRVGRITIKPNTPTTFGNGVYSDGCTIGYISTETLY